MPTDTPTLENLAVHLQKRELEILHCLARGWSYSQIATHTDIRNDCLHVHCHNIRKKTGIQSTRDVEQCKAFLRQRRQLPPAPARQMPLSWTQTEVLRLLALGDSYASISSTLGMGIQTAQNHASEACKRAGIRAAGRYSRLQGIKDYIARLDGTAPVTPLSDPML